MPILLGTCGREKMSKSLGNYVGITEPPQVMYHKVYSIPDSQVENWTTLLTDLPLTEIDDWKDRIAGYGAAINSWKAWLAAEIVRQYHGEQASLEASELEAAVHRGYALPDDTAEVARDGHWANVLDLLVAVGAVPSRGEAKKLVQNGGVQMDGEKVSDIAAPLPTDAFVLKAGKRKFWKISA
jgi:tyrosyl-tRNA synthetase